MCGQEWFSGPLHHAFVVFRTTDGWFYSVEKLVGHLVLQRSKELEHVTKNCGTEAREQYYR